jgi:hypothetical protein
MPRNLGKMAGKKRTAEKAVDRSKEILEKAKAKGIEDDYFFQTTFERYKFQLQLLADLQQDILENGIKTAKVYVKGYENEAPNPAIGEYAKIATCANNTVNTLLKILDKPMSKKTAKEDKVTELLKAIGD